MQKYYQAPNKEFWQGGADSLPNEHFFQTVQCAELQDNLPVKEVAKNFALLGFCCDEGVRRNLGYAGAAQGPQALRQALAKLPIHRVGEENVTIQLLDVGDIICNDGDLEAAQQALSEATALLLKQNIQPILLGGGHEIAWGHYQGITATKPKTNVGIINFDAHFDLGPLKNEQGHSGSPFLQIAQACHAQHLLFNYLCVGLQKTGNTHSLFATADSLGAQWIFAEEVHAEPTGNLLAKLDAFLEQCDVVYLTLCMDVFAEVYAPGVSAPQVLGLTPWQVLPLIRYIAKSGKALSFDIAELSPPCDRNNITAQLAATMIAEFIACANLA
jgi:formiminoglutamase